MATHPLTFADHVRPGAPSQDTVIGSAREPHRWHWYSISSQASNKVPSRSMARMMTARRRASATRAFRRPRRLAILSAQLSSAKLWRARVVAASFLQASTTRGVRRSVGPREAVTNYTMNSLTERRRNVGIPSGLLTRTSSSDRLPETTMMLTLPGRWASSQAIIELVSTSAKPRITAWLSEPF